MILKLNLRLQTAFDNILFFHDSENTMLKKRDGKDIWQGLFDFPLVETKTDKLIEHFTVGKAYLLSTVRLIEPDSLNLLSINQGLTI